MKYTEIALTCVCSLWLIYCLLTLLDFSVGIISMATSWPKKKHLKEKVIMKPISFDLHYNF